MNEKNINGNNPNSVQQGRTIRVEEAQKILADYENASPENKKSKTKIFKENGVKYVRDDKGRLQTRVRSEAEMEYMNKYNAEHYTRTNITITKNEFETIKKKVEFLKQFYGTEDYVESVNDYMLKLCRKAQDDDFTQAQKKKSDAYLKAIKGDKTYSTHNNPNIKRIPFNCRIEEMQTIKETAVKRGFVQYTKYIRFLMQNDTDFIPSLVGFNMQEGAR